MLPLCALSRCMVLLALTVAVAACGAPGISAPATPSRPPAATLRVALVLPGTIDDRSWSQAGYEGLSLIERDLGARVAYEAGISEASAAAVFERFAATGFDLVIGHGAQFYTAAEAVAARFPRVKFAVVGNFPGNNRNLGAISFRNAENAYLVGVVAALKTRTGRIAYIGGVENSAQIEALEALERGARATNPAVTVTARWVGGWTNREQARRLADEAIREGTDIVVQNADMAGVAVFEAAQAAGIYAIGWAQDQHDLAPQTVLTSAIQRVPVLLREAASLVQLGRWEGKQYQFGLQEGALDLAPSYGLLSEAELAQVDAVREDIITGQVNVRP